jgi:hypothetical protein
MSSALRQMGNASCTHGNYEQRQKRDSIEDLFHVDRGR